jgi:bilirubin oxidase
MISGTLANSVHLHGSYSRAPFDGWADDTTDPGQYKDYYYPNRQNARTLWYHDHAIDHTAKNAYFGQAGFYILSDAQEDALGLPSDKFDLPLALAAKRYNSDGSLWDPEANGETTSVFGDVIHVNGVPWPYHNVEPRKYRLRFLNTGISRSYQLYFESSDAAGKQIPFTVFASDAGLTLNPVQTNDLYISDAERWEVIFDFTSYAGKNVTVRNSRKVAADEDYNSTDQVMRKYLLSKSSTRAGSNVR